MKIVWCNGSFDILHSSHVELLKIAKKLSCGGYVFVGIDSDSRIKDRKGLDRPYNSSSDRRAVLEALRYVDVVLEFSSDSELKNLIQMVSPDIMLLGGDYKNKEIIGNNFAKELRFLDRNNSTSSSSIIKKIQQHEYSI